MAKVKFTAVVDAVRGKLNGTVFSKNRYGAIMRSKGTVNNPQTSFQQAVRATFGALSQAFRSLSAEAVQAWNDAAQNFPRTDVFGDQYYQSGNALFLGLNKVLNILGIDPLSLPPVPASITEAVLESVSWDIVENEYVLAISTDLTGDERLIIEATPTHTPSQRFQKNRFRFLTLGPLGSGVEIRIPYAVYSGRFGAPSLGALISFRVRVANQGTGQSGVPSTASVAQGSL